MSSTAIPSRGAAGTADEPALVSAGRWAFHGSLAGDARLLAAGLAISAGIIIGMYLESRILMTVGAVAAAGVSLVSPALGLVVLCFMGPLKPPPVIPAPGFTLILVAAILLGCVYRLPFERTRLRVATPVLLLVAFLLYAFVQQVPEMLAGYSGTRAHDIGFLFYQLLAGVGTVVAAGFVLRDRSPNAVFAALLLSAAFAAGLAVLTADGALDGHLANLVAESDVESRATGPFGNPNAFGQFLAYGCTLAAAWIAATRSLGLRWGLLAISGVLVYAIWLSLSRGAAVTLLAGLVALAFTRSRAAGIVSAAIALTLVIVGYPLFVEERLTAEAATMAGLSASDAGRLGAMLAAPAILAMSPIFGVGFGEYRYAHALLTGQGDGFYAHNWYLTVLAEQGFLGFFLWLAILFAIGVALRRRPAGLRSAGAAMLGAFAVGGLFLQPPTSFRISVIPAIVLTAALVARWDERLELDPPDPHRTVPAGGRPQGSSLRP